MSPHPANVSFCTVGFCCNIFFSVPRFVHLTMRHCGSIPSWISGICCSCFPIPDFACNTDCSFLHILELLQSFGPSRPFKSGTTNWSILVGNWNHLSPSSLHAIRKLYDVPQERGRPASLAKVARHFGTIDLLVVHLLFLQRLSVNPPPILCLTAGSLVRLPYSDDDDVSDDSVHLAEPSRAPSPELICPSQPGLRAARQARVTSSHQEGLHAPYGVVIALFPSDLWRVAFVRTLSWDLPKKKQMLKLVYT